MITLKELKEKIQQIEIEIESKGINPDDIYLMKDYQTPIETLDLYFTSNEDYGTFIGVYIE